MELAAGRNNATIKGFESRALVQGRRLGSETFEDSSSSSNDSDTYCSAGEELCLFCTQRFISPHKERGLVAKWLASGLWHLDFRFET
ncbi:hypothetical protein CEXT_676021 [Caerostris extrusa]|uniref:Uncharacterized protein n=1 Tax=Caerostris extrusa TaxID=172846 RepID=A0AAV4X0R1_CAEEX|nr:hypothetical protein CEXT_676021 [Caerostris extrusa]